MRDGYQTSVQSPKLKCRKFEFRASVFCRHINRPLRRLAKAGTSPEPDRVVHTHVD
jgi:hypothetical protein